MELGFKNPCGYHPLKFFLQYRPYFRSKKIGLYYDIHGSVLLLTVFLARL